jgi:hypothetical protein
MNRIRQVFIATLLVAAPALSQTPWYTAYYASWQQDSFGSTWNQEFLGEPADQIDWTGITHVVHFGNGNVVSTPPYSLFATDSTEITYGAGGSRSVNYQDLLISTCHGKGIKVLLSIQAVDGAPLLAVVQDANKLNVFCEWIVQYAKRHGYDGLEIDWESNFPSTAQMTTFITALRSTLDKYYTPVHALIATSANLSDYNMYSPSLDTMIDQYNIQTYAMMWTPNDKNVTWYTCAVYPGTSNNGAEGALDGITNGDVGYPQKWVNAGHDPSRIGLLLPTFGYAFNNATDILQAGTLVAGHNGTWSVTQNATLLKLVPYATTKSISWDDVRKSSYISGNTGSATVGLGVKGNFFCTISTPQWIHAVVDYYKTKTFNGKRLGGLSLYSLTEDFDPTKPAGAGRNMIHDAMRDALLGVAPTPFGSLAASPTSVAPGDSVTLSWTSSGADSGGIDHGVGTVALPNGSKKVQVAATTTFTLTLKNSAGTSTYPATVTVTTPTAPTGTFSASPSHVTSGDSVTLSWTSTNATSGQITPGVGLITPLASGSRRVMVTVSTTFTLALSNPSGTTNYTASVTADGAPPTPRKDFHLDQNYPNPFNPTTHISYSLPSATTVRLSVYNVLGQVMVVLVDGFQTAGPHSVDLSGDRLSTGLYFYILETPDFKDVRKMAVLH